MRQWDYLLCKYFHSIKLPACPLNGSQTQSPRVLATRSNRATLRGSPPTVDFLRITLYLEDGSEICNTLVSYFGKLEDRDPLIRNIHGTPGWAWRPVSWVEIPFSHASLVNARNALRLSSPRSMPTLSNSERALCLCEFWRTKCTCTCATTSSTRRVHCLSSRSTTTI